MTRIKILSLRRDPIYHLHMSATIQSTMIRASAGSGKTYQLANRFLSLLVLGVRPEKIIALTFTRKAAGEFANRIMTRLAEGAADEHGASKLSNELLEIIEGRGNIPALLAGLPSDGSGLPTMNAAFFQQKLQQLIGVLDRLSLSTLDSYFVRIVRNFALELGLNGFELMEDSAVSTERLRTMASLLANRSTSQKERETFLQSFKQATWGVEENRLSETLETFITDHQNRWLSAPEPEKWGTEHGLWPDGSPLAQGAEVSIPELAAKVINLLGTPSSPNVTYMKGWIKVCELLSEHNPGTTLTMNTQLGRAIPRWRDYADGGLVDSPKYEFSLPLGQTISKLLSAWILREIRVRMERTQGLHALISAYEARYQNHVRNRGRLCFSDLTLLLAGEGAMASWDEHQRSMMDFRLDARYDHWLLDEFQDTSRPQWQAIGTLVDEIMQDSDGERSLFVVGDTKQSIYGWRGGEPRLFDDLQSHYGSRLADWDMDTSYRSGAPVLDLVNRVCDLAGVDFQELFPQESLQRWKFNQHVSSNPEKTGHALVIETEKSDEKNDAEHKRLRRYEAVQKLLEVARPIESGQSCAILVRSNDHAIGIVDYLRSAMPEINIAAESDAAITDGPLGSALLDLFRWLAHPSDSFAQRHIEMSPLHSCLMRFTQTQAEESSEALWGKLTYRVGQSGVAQFTDDVIAELKQGRDFSAYGESRLAEISAAAHRFSSQGGTLDDWIGVLENAKLRERTHEGIIQVMTVHKSKGLGFDVVILPELDLHDEFDVLKNLDLLEKKGTQGNPEYLLKRPGKELCEAEDEMRGMLESWRAEQCYERFCNLYVALTRAKLATYCVLDPTPDPNKKNSPNSKRRYQDWIRRALGVEETPSQTIRLNGNNYPLLYQSGDWQTGEVESPTPTEHPIPQLPAPQTRMSRRVASDAKTYQAGVSQGQRKGMRFGNMVHAIFEKVTWLDDLTDQKNLGQGGAADTVRECLNADSIAPFFTQPEGEFQLLREQAIETQIDGQWVSGVIDRAVLTLENDKVTSISIIDFKTDQVETAEELAEKYRGQVETYARAMHTITAVPLENIQSHLLSTHLREVVTVH